VLENERFIMKIDENLLDAELQFENLEGFHQEIKNEQKTIFDTSNWIGNLRSFSELLFKN